MSQTEDLVEDAQIDGLRGRSRFGGFVQGALLGSALSSGALLIASLVTPLPDHLPGVGRVEVISGEQSRTPSQPPEPPEPPQAAQSAQGSEGQGAPDPAEDAADGGPAALAPDSTAVTEPEPEPAPEEVAAAPQTPSEQPATATASDQAQTDDDGVASAPTEPATGAASEAPSDPVADAPAARTLSLAGPALSVNARAFRAPEEAPLLSVVLEDAGNGALGAETLQLLTMPLTLAIRPNDEAARSLGEVASGAGHEVLAELPMPVGDESGDPSDGLLRRETPPETLQSQTLRYLAEMDMAIGATAPQGAALANDQRVMEAVLTPVATHGFAYLDIKAGIGSAARRIAGATGVNYVEGTHYAPVEATEEQVYQMLDGAAFQARRQGSAVVTIASSQSALKALLRWGLERGGQEVWFAPLSAVIARQTDG